MTTKMTSKSLKQLEKIISRKTTFATMIESLRLSEEVSQLIFAKKLGISASHLCDIEKGRKVVSPARAAQFAKVLGLSEAQFIRFAIQDELNRSGLKFTVSLEKAS